MDDAPASTAVIDDLEHPLLLFDGVCNLCNALVRFTVRFDDAGTFRFASLQSTIGQAVLDEHDLPTDDFDSIVLVEGDDYYTKSAAVLRVCRHLDGPWPLLYLLVYLPEPVRDSMYGLVAGSRYQVFGRTETDACSVPSPEIRERFAERTLDER